MYNRTIIFSEEIFNKKTTMTYGRDVALGLKNIIGNKDAYGETYNIVRNEALTWGNIFKIYNNVFNKIYGRNLKIELVSNNEFLNCYPGNYQVLYDRMYDRIFDNAKISKMVDTSQFISYEEGLANCLDTFIKKSVFSNIDWRIHASMDKISNEWTNCNEIKGELNREIYNKYRI